MPEKKRCLFGYLTNGDKCGNSANGECLALKKLGVPDGDRKNISKLKYSIMAFKLMRRYFAERSYLSYACSDSEENVSEIDSVIKSKENGE